MPSKRNLQRERAAQRSLHARPTPPSKPPRGPKGPSGSRGPARGPLGTPGGAHGAPRPPKGAPRQPLPGAGRGLPSLPGQGRPKKLLPAPRHGHGPAGPGPRPGGSAGGKAPAKGKTISLWDGQQVTITRRHFLYGVAGIAACAALGGVGYALESMGGSDEVSEVLSVPEDAVTSSDDCTLIEDAATAMRLVSERKMPRHSLVFANSDSVAACLLPTDVASPLVHVGLLQLGNGSLTMVLEQAVDAAEGFAVFDVRANEAGMVWVEANVLKGLWRVRAAALDGAALGEPLLVAEGDGAWEMPQLTVAGGYAFWQVMPKADGPAEDEPSRLMRAAFGSPVAEEAYASAAPMASAPYSAGDSVVITPRASRGKSYYQLTRLDATTAEVLDTLVLPMSMKPLEAGWGPTGFTFAFDGIYDYGGGIANLGTYAPVSLPGDGGDLTGVASAAAYDQARWFRFARTPITAPAWCGPWLMVRSTNAVCGVSMQESTFFQLPLEEGSTEFGDALASTGCGNRVVTFADVDYAPLNGEAEQYCLVRVWEPA